MSVKVIGYLVRHIFHNSVAIILALLLSLYVVTLLSYAFLQPVHPVDRSYQFDIKSSQSLIGWRSIWSHMSHCQFMTLWNKKTGPGSPWWSPTCLSCSCLLGAPTMARWAPCTAPMGLWDVRCTNGALHQWDQWDIRCTNGALHQWDHGTIGWPLRAIDWDFQSAACTPL